MEGNNTFFTFLELLKIKTYPSWKEKAQLRATPTILVNGYKLPENYKIEDLRYFTEFNIDIK